MPVRDLALRLAAGTTYAVNPYRATKVPTSFERHVMNRLGCGYARSTWQEMKRTGGAEAWFEQQLDPEAVPESATAEALTSWFPDLLDSPQRMWERRSSKGGWGYARDLANWTMLRRIYSRRQVHETMVDLWSNHFHITAQGGTAWVQRLDYDRVIRQHALGRFEDLLVAATLHPSMLLYLDNFRSVRNAPNENHGRELLELHTVGRTSGYTEQMVKDSAKILSGYTVKHATTWEMTYNSALHTTGAVQVLGFTAGNATADGSQLTVQYLKYLANHPATARTVARRIATRFVSDSPSDALVNDLARVFLDSGTDIKAVLRRLVASSEFRGSAGQKTRTPVEDLVATSRVLQIRARRPASDSSFASAITWLHQGLPLYQWPRPDGPPERNPEWASASRMMSSFRMHWNLGGGYYPSVDASYRAPAWWLPETRIRLDQYLDHMCRMLLGRGSTSREVKAVCQATGHQPGDTITKEHALAGWMFVRLAAVLLDSPTHMSR